MKADWSCRSGNMTNFSTWCQCQIMGLTSLLLPQNSNSMEHSLGETISVLTSQEILCILWNLKLHYCVHKRPTCVPILSWINPVHILSFYFLEVYLNVILPSVPRFSKLSVLGFRTKTVYVPLLSPIYATCQIYYIILDFVTQIIFGENNTSYCALSSSPCYLLHLRSSILPQQPHYMSPCPCDQHGRPSFKPK